MHDPLGASGGPGDGPPLAASGGPARSEDRDPQAAASTSGRPPTGHEDLRVEAAWRHALRAASAASEAVAAGATSARGSSGGPGAGAVRAAVAAGESRVLTLNDALARAWALNDRAASLKLAAAAAGLLAVPSALPGVPPGLDGTADSGGPPAPMPAEAPDPPAALIAAAAALAYPALWAAVAQLLDPVGALIWERCVAKCERDEDERGASGRGRAVGPPLPACFDAADVRPAARQTAATWLLKLGSQPRLLPRMYLEATTLRCVCLLTTDAERPRQLLAAAARLSASLRGAGDAIARTYALAFLARKTVSLLLPMMPAARRAPFAAGRSHADDLDSLLSSWLLRSMGELADTHRALLLLRPPPAAGGAGGGPAALDPQAILPLLEPAIDWLLACALRQFGQLPGGAAGGAAAGACLGPAGAAAAGVAEPPGCTGLIMDALVALVAGAPPTGDALFPAAPALPPLIPADEAAGVEYTIGDWRGLRGGSDGDRSSGGSSSSSAGTCREIGLSILARRVATPAGAEDATGGEAAQPAAQPAVSASAAPSTLRPLPVWLRLLIARLPAAALRPRAPRLRAAVAALRWMGDVGLAEAEATACERLLAAADCA